MDTLKNVVRRPALVGVGLAGITLALVLLLPLPSEAIACGVAYHYYSDASYITLVGWAGVLPHACGCTWYSWGTFTSYRLTGPSYCREPA